MIVVHSRPSWAREPNALSVRVDKGGMDAATEKLKAMAADRKLKFSEIRYVSVDGVEALYAQGEALNAGN